MENEYNSSQNLENSVERLAAIFGGVEEGIYGAIEGYIQIRSETLNSLRGHFESEELQIVVNTISENDVKPNIAAHAKLANMCVRSQPIGNTSLYKVADKVRDLSGPQIYFLLAEILRIKKEGSGFEGIYKLFGSN